MMPENNKKKTPEHTAEKKWTKFTSGWIPYVEKPISLEALDEIMVSASIPSFGFYFILFLSAIITTLGLLANSAPAIIGAMIMAPLMAPIISLAYGIDIFDWKLAVRSLFTIVTGVILVIIIAFLCSNIVGIRFAGTEILSRTSPTLLDLGIAVSAGAAAAFFYTRQSMTTSLAGIAISVSLVPPLAVTGIGISYGHSALTDLGLSLSEIGVFYGVKDIAIGSFVLFTTNFLGIILFACLVLLSQGYGQWKKAGLGILIILISSYTLFDPLQKSLFKITVKSKVLSLLVSLPKEYPHIFSAEGRIEGIHVDYRDEALHVDIEGIFPKLDISAEEAQEKINLALDTFQMHLQRELGTSTTIELDIIPVDILNFNSERDDAEVKNPNNSIAP